jgi:hypothetical protein
MKRVADASEMPSSHRRRQTWRAGGEMLASSATLTLHLIPGIGRGLDGFIVLVEQRLQEQKSCYPAGDVAHLARFARIERSPEDLLLAIR